MLQLIKRQPQTIGGSLIPPQTHLGLFADENGQWYALDSTGQPSLLGNGIANIQKTSTDGSVDTYTITLTDGREIPFTVTNGSVTSVNGQTGDVEIEIPEPQVVDPLDLTIRQSSPSPTADTVRVFGKQSAGRAMLSVVGPSGLDTKLQPHLGANRVSLWMPNGAGNTAATTLGGLWTAPALTAVALADTPIGSIRKAQITTGATAATAVQLASEIAYSRNTGFHTISHFTPFSAGNPVSRRFFSGLSAVALSNVALSGYAGMGVQADLNELTLRIRGFDGVQTDLGLDFPSNTFNVWYRFEMFCPPLGETVGWQITDMLTGRTESGEFTGAQLPAEGVFMSYRTGAVTSAAVAQNLWLGHHMIETNL